MFKVPGGLNYGIFFFQMNSDDLIETQTLNPWHPRPLLTTELFKLMLYIDIRKLNYLEIIHKTLNFWREIQIKDIHQREANIPAQSLTTTTLMKWGNSDMQQTVTKEDLLFDRLVAYPHIYIMIIIN